MAGLSVCVLANSPGPFLREALAPLREIADEVVVAAGGPVPADDLVEYGVIADRLFQIEFSYIERHLAWLHAQCRCEWVLRLDGDEVPSAEMVAAVSAVKAERRLSSAMFARRHVLGGLDRYITQEPWYPDFQVRMVRNDGTARFAGLQHTSAERTLPARMCEAPLYHLSLLAPEDARVARATHYESLRPGLVAPSGLPVNESLFPERLPDVLTAPVPAADRAVLARVLGAVADESPRSPVRPVPVTLAEMDVRWAGRAVAESAYEATVEMLGEHVPLAPGETRPFYFAVQNRGTETWSWDPSVGPYLHLVYRWLGAGREPLEDWRPAFFTEWVDPGTRTIVPVHVQSPASPGTYWLQARLRHSPQERVFGAPAETEMLVQERGAWLR